MTLDPGGTTPSERYLAKLCRNSFLSLWSFPNLYTDEGRKGGKGPGRELCDLLVAFGQNLIIFSVKFVEYDALTDTTTAWRRWFKRAVLKSADQLYGAESWIRRRADRIYTDAGCKTRVNLKLEANPPIQIHRIAVALGIQEACRRFFGGSSIGSLMIDNRIVGQAHFANPFHLGQIDPEKGFVHVLDDFNLDKVLGELDTVSDFLAYLTKRENLLSRARPAIAATGEEQLLSIYLTRLNAAGEHDFDLPFERNHDAIMLDEGFWEDFVRNPQYWAKKKADQESYLWDGLIEHLIDCGRDSDLVGSNQEYEPLLRILAAESRLARRALSGSLHALMARAKPGLKAARLTCSKGLSETAYIYLILPVPTSFSRDWFNEFRHRYLEAYCKVAKLYATEVKRVVGIAFELSNDNWVISELIALETDGWTPEMQAEAERLQRECDILLGEKTQHVEGRTIEYPE